MRSRRAPFHNDLTQALSSPHSISLLKFLFHTDLATTVRNEAEEMIAYLREDDPENHGQSRLATLFEYALTPRGSSPRYRLSQPGHNATLILQHPSVEIFRLVMETQTRPETGSLLHRFTDFITEPSDFRKTSVLAGHFQQIFERCLVASRRDWHWLSQSTLERIVDFAIANIDIMAYQELLKMLVTIQGFLDHFFRVDGSIPGEVVFFRKIASASRIVVFNARNDRGMFLDDDSTCRAYLLLITLSLALSERPSTLHSMRDIAVITDVLECGVGAGTHSIVATQAFRVLDAVIFESENAPSVADRPDVRAVVERFARGFTFSREPTPQTVAALRVFADCRFGSQRHPPVVFHLPRRKDECCTHEPPPGFTPVEIYGHFVVEKEVVSDRLCLRVLAKLEELAGRVVGLREGEPCSDIEMMERVIRADAPIVDFYRTPVGELGRPLFDVLFEVAPKVPQAIVFEDDGRQMRSDGAERVCLNGAIQKLAEFVMEKRVCSLKGGAEPIPNDLQLTEIPAESVRLVLQRSLICEQLEDVGMAERAEIRS
jgi:hypothetical protein